MCKDITSKKRKRNDENALIRKHLPSAVHKELKEIKGCLLQSQLRVSIFINWKKQRLKINTEEWTTYK